MSENHDNKQSAKGEQRMTPADILAEIRRLGLSTPSEAAALAAWQSMPPAHATATRIVRSQSEL